MLVISTDQASLDHSLPWLFLRPGQAAVWWELQVTPGTDNDSKENHWFSSYYRILLEDLYPLVINIAVENHHAINGKIRYFYGHVPWLC